MPTRYEILPFGSAESEAAAAPRPLVLTVTCSPRHGVDHTIDVAERLVALGHRAVVHLAARMLRDAQHADAVVERLAAAGLDDVFLIACDGAEPLGPYASALELLPLIAGHPRRPRQIGIAAYPEGHPLIDDATLDAALQRKAREADYLVTQMCFYPAALTRWIGRTRDAGIELPVYLGLPGAVDRRRLLEVSMRVGVGTSISFLRKQQGIRQFLGRPHHAADHLHEALAPLVGDTGFGVAGLHYFTFNRLNATLAWESQRDADEGSSRKVARDV
jgi:methylenetetrahydrofolate reductase (NADPH)